MHYSDRAAVMSSIHTWWMYMSCCLLHPFLSFYRCWSLLTNLSPSNAYTHPLYHNSIAEHLLLLKVHTCKCTKGIHSQHKNKLPSDPSKPQPIPLYTISQPQTISPLTSSNSSPTRICPSWAAGLSGWMPATNTLITLRSLLPARLSPMPVFPRENSTISSWPPRSAYLRCSRSANRGLKNGSGYSKTSNSHSYCFMTF